MRNIIFSLFLLIGCAANVDENAQDLPSNKKETTPPSADISTDVSYEEGSGCVEVTYKIIVIGDRTVWQPIFTSCNQGINFYKGCPSPDKGRPVENINEFK